MSSEKTSTEEITKADPILELINTEIARVEWEVSYHDKKARESREHLIRVKSGLAKHLNQ